VSIQAKQVPSYITSKCSICFDFFAPTHQVINLDCHAFKHIFHWHCLLDWLKRQRSCPLCRKPIYYLVPRSVVQL